MFRLSNLLIIAAMFGLCHATSNTTDLFYVQVVFNDGDGLTEHRSCSNDDFIKVRDAVSGFTERRRLGASAHRLLPNCPRLCCGYDWGECAVYGCAGYPTPTSNADGCRRRQLEEGSDNSVTVPGFIFVDPDDPMWYDGGDRRLSQQHMLTIEECNAKRAEIYQHLLSTLPETTTNCNNFVLGPIRMQCVVAIA